METVRRGTNWPPNGKAAASRDKAFRKILKHAITKGSPVSLGVMKYNNVEFQIFNEIPLVPNLIYQVSPYRSEVNGYQDKQSNFVAIQSHFLGHNFIGGNVQDARGHFHACQVIEITKYWDNSKDYSHLGTVVWFDAPMMIVHAQNPHDREIVGVIIDVQDHRLEKCHDHYFYEEDQENLNQEHYVDLKSDQKDETPLVNKVVQYEKNGKIFQKYSSQNTKGQKNHQKAHAEAEESKSFQEEHGPPITLSEIRQQKEKLGVQFASLDHIRAELVFKGYQIPIYNGREQISIGVFGKQQAGKSTFLKALTEINFETGKGFERTTKGISHGISQRDGVVIHALDAEGFNSDDVQLEISRELKKQYGDSKQPADYTNTALEINRKACLNEASVLLCLCDKFIVIADTNENFSEMKLYFSHEISIPQKQLVFAIKVKFSQINNDDLKQKMSKKILETFGLSYVNQDNQQEYSDNLQIIYLPLFDTDEPSFAYQEAVRTWWNTTIEKHVYIQRNLNKDIKIAKEMLQSIKYQRAYPTQFASAFIAIQSWREQAQNVRRLLKFAQIIYDYYTNIELVYKANAAILGIYETQKEQGLIDIINQHHQNQKASKIGSGVIGMGGGALGLAAVLLGSNPIGWVAFSVGVLSLGMSIGIHLAHSKESNEIEGEKEDLKECGSRYHSLKDLIKTHNKVLEEQKEYKNNDFENSLLLFICQNMKFINNRPLESQEKIIQDKFVIKMSKDFLDEVAQDFRDFLNKQGLYKKQEAIPQIFKQQQVDMVAFAPIAAPLFVQKLVAQQVLQRVTAFKVAEVSTLAERAARITSLTAKSTNTVSTRITSLLPSVGSKGVSGAGIAAFTDVAVDSGQYAKQMALNVAGKGARWGQKLMTVGGCALGAIAIGLELNGIYNVVNEKDQKESVNAIKDALERLKKLNEGLKSDIDVYQEYFTTEAE